MRRGEIHLVDFEPVKGQESNKSRPAVIVSNDGANQTALRLGRGVITVVPVTGNVSKVHAFQVFLPADDCGLKRESKAQAEQIRSVSIERIGALLGALTAKLQQELNEAIRLHLGL